MTRNASLRWLTVLFVALPVAAARAQSSPEPFVMVSVGLSTSSGGLFVERDQYAGELVGGVRFRQRGAVSLLGAVAVGSDAANGSDLVCALYPGATGGPCQPAQPGIVHASALLGVEARGRRASIGLMLGPGMFHASPWTANYVSNDGASTLGIETRLDAAVFPAPRVGLLVSGRHLLLGSLDGSRLRIRSIMLGVRLQ